MSMNLSLKSKATIILLGIIIILSISSLFVFNLLDAVIHHDLYLYGLQFSINWAEPYYANSSLFKVSMTITIIAAALCIMFFVNQIRKNNGLHKLLCYFLLIMVVVLGIFESYTMMRIDYIINHDLYSYNLVFDYNWAAPYWFNIRLIFVLIGFVCLLSLLSIIFVYFSSSKNNAYVSTVKLTCFSLISTGIIALALSILFDLSTLVFVGLGLLLWGFLFLYVRTTEYVKKPLLDIAVFSRQLTIERILTELDYKGDALYLPPRYSKKPEEQRLFVSKEKGTIIPTPEQILSQGDRFFIESPPGLLLIPTGIEFIKLFEKRIEMSLLMTDADFLKTILPRILIDDLEVVKDFKIGFIDSRITVKISGSKYSFSDLNDDYHNMKNVDVPIISAIACAISKVMGDCVIVEDQQIIKKGEEITITFLRISSAGEKIS